MQRELQDHLPIESSPFLSRLDRLHQTGHDNRVPNILKEFGLQADIPSSYVSIGLKNPHPVLRLRDVVETFDKVPGKAQQHLLAGNGPKQLGDFWSKWAKIHPGHDVFTTHRGHLHEMLACNAAPGRGHESQKEGHYGALGTDCVREGFQTQCWAQFPRYNVPITNAVFSPFGEGHMPRRKEYCILFLGSGIKIWMIAIAMVYKMQSVPGINRLYPVVLACKGDWPALTKAGRLLRHHLRDSKKGFSTRNLPSVQSWPKELSMECI